MNTRIPIANDSSISNFDRSQGQVVLFTGVQPTTTLRETYAADIQQGNLVEDDKFEVTLTLEGSSVTIPITTASINTATWRPISGIDFPGGDNTVFETGFIDFAFDLRAYQGQRANLQFRVFDVGDAIYDTAALIDSIRITSV